ncbi:hypothetical protein RMSM_04652 [Rhodopirellula maiorica SM1]|uniref:Uncharacterized protein n=1 Tax=Rhodopirellula maiorica SM1 TaxID=1265738 RepID=M5RGA1_9BACT|nr:hypothetical protein RMSM_04652 [Rhodopirellula maiorica SM1]
MSLIYWVVKRRLLSRRSKAVWLRRFSGELVPRQQSMARGIAVKTLGNSNVSPILQRLAVGKLIQKRWSAIADLP